MKCLEINLYKIIKIWDHSIFLILFKNNLLRLISQMKIENLISRNSLSISFLILLYLEFLYNYNKKYKKKKGDILWIIENMNSQNGESMPLISI